MDTACPVESRHSPQIDGDAVLECCFDPLLSLAHQARSQISISAAQRSMVYALRSAEVECIGKGKTPRPKSSAARSVSLPRTVRDPWPRPWMPVPSTGMLGPRHGEAHWRAALRIHVDKGYRSHNHPRFRGWISSQVRRFTASIREMKHRAAVEPVIDREGQAPHGPQLSQGKARRPHQSCPRRCLMQLQLWLAQPPFRRGSTQLAGCAISLQAGVSATFGCCLAAALPRRCIK